MQFELAVMERELPNHRYGALPKLAKTQSRVLSSLCRTRTDAGQVNAGDRGKATGLHSQAGEQPCPVGFFGRDSLAFPFIDPSPI